MTIVKRLRLLTAILGASAACIAVGTSVFGDIAKTKSANPAKPLDAPKLIDELAKTKFSDKPTLAYARKTGETAFAWQLKPSLTAAAPRAKDILVMVDTSASQSGEPMERAAQIVNALAGQLGVDDRLDIWTANLGQKDHTRSLTGGFKPASDKAVKKAAEALLAEEYASGAVDLKADLELVVAQFEQKPNRQQVILYLGDGESTAGTPLKETVRVAIGQGLVEKNVQFFSVPLGATIAANTLHGFGMLTGGTVVRVKEDLAGGQGRASFTKRLIETLDVPVLKVEKMAMTPAASETYPAQLPPLRADRSTLVMGTLAKASDRVSMAVEGTVAGKKVKLELADALAAPSQDHYFLAAMIDQWRGAETKDAPVVLPADRALSMASEQFRLYRDEFVELAIQAITADKLDHAEKLFQAAAKVDPDCVEATAGAKAVAKIRGGEMTKEQFNKRTADADRKIGAQAPASEAPKPASNELPKPTPEANDPAALQRAQLAQRAADAESRALVEETIKRVRQLRETDPDLAKEELKRQRDNIRTLDRISDANRTRLVTDLEALLRDVDTRSGEIKRRNEATRERISRARALLNEYDLKMDEETRTTARIERFRYLMHQAKFELAYREAQVMEQERVNRGLSVPPEVYATYRIGQSATQLREQREMKRLREDRYLLTMMQVDKSFVPYPDEPPVHFPPASVWRELTKRREPYEFKNQGVGQNSPASLKTLQNILEGTEDAPPGVPRRVPEMEIKGKELGLILETLESKYNKQVKFVVRDELFRGLNDTNLENIKKYLIKNDTNLSGLTLANFLDVLLAECKGSYIVRPEYIEITTQEQRLYQKVTRAFQIGDLALAVPNSINQQALQQNLAVFGAQLQFFGQGVGQAQQFGQLGNGGGFGQGGFGQGGGGNFGGGGGPLGGGGGPLGGGGGPLGGMMGQIGGGLGAQGGQQNLGVGGGITGVTGGQLGQFGNLGGQFGIQGNNQSKILIQVIAEMVAPGEWNLNFTGVGANNTPRGGDDEVPTYYVKPEQLNSIGYYPVSNALIVRATSRYHPDSAFKFSKGADNVIMQGPNNGRDKKAAAPNGNNGGQNVAAADAKPEFNNPATDAQTVVKNSGGDPKKLWNGLFDRAVTDPNLVVTAAEFLFEYKEYAHAAESLKANLRRGRATGAWAHEALTIALQASQANPSEVERAALSAIDLDPQDPKAYLRAAKTVSELGHNDRAIALCQRAADIEPNLPAIYANALAYADADKVGDVKTDAVNWATKNLLRRDWPSDGIDHAKVTKKSVEGIAKKLREANRGADADAVLKSIAEEKNRDLIVELRWQGQADLDLVVQEPTSTTCSETQKRTSGGGVLRCNLFEDTDDNRSEIYTAAQAFSGSYTLNVQSSLGRAIGNKATLKVTKFAGTQKEEFEIYTVDLADPKPVKINVDGGGRSELASVGMDDFLIRQASAPITVGATGVAAGFGGADAATQDALNSPATSKSVAPVSLQRQEVHLPSVSPSLPGMRLVGQVQPGRDVAEYTASPVFTGKAFDIPMPKVQLLPGSGK